MHQLNSMGLSLDKCRIATNSGLRMTLTMILLSLILVLSACSSSGLEGVPEMGAATDSVTTKLNDEIESTRQLTVYLQLDSDSGFQPVYPDRIVVAQAVVPEINRTAEAKMLVQGVNTIVVGSNCDELLQQYPEITECVLVDSVEVTYGYIQSTANTDQEGFASLQVGQEDIRVSVRSWPTIEDDKCHWSGSAIAKSNVESVAIPLLVFCE